MDTQPPPVVLVMSGADPSGGAGVQADIEALASHGCHTAPVITTITIQDTNNIKEIVSVDGKLIEEQARAVLEDLSVSVIKIGLLTDTASIEAAHNVIIDYPDTPVVLDTILASGGGTRLADDDMIDAYQQLLFPRVTVLTPNSTEARLLAPEADNLEACGMALLDRGCEYVLITGTHENTPKVCNSLFANHRHLETFHYERLEESYHGSGCTLAASIAGLWAQGLEPFSAIHEAQNYTWETLRHGYRLGMGQRLPDRFFWCRHEEE